MGETKSRILKLGKLFGVLLGLELEKESLQRDSKASLVELLASTKKSKLAATEEVNGQEDGDELYPLPNDRHLGGQLYSQTPLPPAEEVNSAYGHLVHPQPKAGPFEEKLQPVLRLLLTNSVQRKKTGGKTPVSRPLLTKRSTLLPTMLPAAAGSAAGSAPSASTPSVSSVAPSAAPSATGSVPSAAPGGPLKLRFRMFEDGSHEHNLRAAKRQEKLLNMLKDLLGAKKLRDGAKSAVPNILLPAAKDGPPEKEKPPTLFAGLVLQVKNNTSPYHHDGELLDPMSQQDCRLFVEKYGRCQEVIGRGSFGVVRISHKKPGGPANAETLYAVKEFKKRPNELEKKYLRRLTSEFCILSLLKDINIIDTLDLLKDAKGDYCEVMEFCSGGDLYTLIIAAGKLEYAEADCFFKQLLRGVNYMHDMGVAHRDLKPENLLLTQQGVLKITDFGNGECFRMAWEDDVQLSEGVAGSSPYIAPEEFTQEQFDPRCVDIWACGVIYMAMRTGRQLWKLANPKKDEFFEEYLRKRKDATGYEPIEALKRARCRNVIYSILDPLPLRRITGKQILNSEWGREIKVCAAALPQQH